MTRPKSSSRARSEGRHLRIVGAAENSKASPHADVATGKWVDLVVLAGKPKQVLCRILGSTREATLRVAAHDEVPGEIVTVIPTVVLAKAQRTILEGKVQSRRIEADALGLVPLALHDQGEWDPDTEYWGRRASRSRSGRGRSSRAAGDPCSSSSR